MTVEDVPLTFVERSRSIRFHEKHRVCEKGDYETYGYVRGNHAYSTGTHTIRMKFEKVDSPKSNDVEWSPWVFVGICSMAERSAHGDVRYHRLRSAYGWSTNGDIWMNGMGKRIQWPGVPIENDVLELTVDCDARTLTLLNERTHEKTREMKVNLEDKTQFPWCFYLVLANSGYRVRLL